MTTYFIDFDLMTVRSTIANGEDDFVATRDEIKASAAYFYSNGRIDAVAYRKLLSDLSSLA